MCHAHKIFVVLAATFALVTGATTVAEPVYEGHAGESTEVDGAKHVNERPVGARPASDRKYLDPNARTDRDWNGDAADPSDDFEPGKNEPNHRTIILFPGLASSRLRISRIGKKSACGGSLDDSLGGGIRGSVWVTTSRSVPVLHAIRFVSMLIRLPPCVRGRGCQVHRNCQQFECT
eukprot:m.165497 g.165497  ORF g.165497 m.165497 type:complete len:177 (+) comp18138_c0_seq10:309-839(+)